MVFFQGSWMNKFDVNKTKPGDFKLTNGNTVKVPMMNQKKKFHFG